MTAAWRYVIVAVLLLFAWKGSSLTVSWPPPDTDPAIPKPEPAIMAWAAPLRPILPTMLAKDRQYLASLYDAMAFVLIRDGKREDPIISTTDRFVVFHAGTLRLAVDRAAVGKYPGLGEAIDQAFVSAVGADQKALSEADRSRLVAACNALAWSLKVHGE